MYIWLKSSRMKIYTKKGDKGQTSLFGGNKISKDHLRVEAYGTIDEFNSFLGLLLAKLPDEIDLPELKKAQHILFNIGSNLANDTTNFKSPELKDEQIEELEIAIDNMQATLTELRNFILPGGSELVSLCHICRTICRRAERRVVSVAAVIELDAILIKYLNRLSDYLFVLGRYTGMRTDSPEVHWDPSV